MLRYRFAKEFHVSPFMPMEANYDWRFGAPGKRLAVHMENYIGGERVFDATLDLSRREITRPCARAGAARVSVHDAERHRRHLQAGAEAVVEAHSFPCPSLEGCPHHVDDVASQS